MNDIWMITSVNNLQNIDMNKNWTFYVSKYETEKTYFEKTAIQNLYYKIWQKMLWKKRYNHGSSIVHYLYFNV